MRDLVNQGSIKQSKLDYAALDEDNSLVLDLTDINSFIEDCKKNFTPSRTTDEAVEFDTKNIVSVETFNRNTDNTSGEEISSLQNVQDVDDTTLNQELLNVVSHSTTLTEEENQRHEFYHSIKASNKTETKNSSLDNSSKSSVKISANNAVTDEDIKQRIRQQRLQKSTRISSDAARQYSDKHLGLFDRTIHAILLSLFYATGGITIDVSIYILRAVFMDSYASILWMFTPILFMIGFVVGFFSNQEVTLNTSNDKKQNVSVTADVINGVVVALSISIVVWFFLMLMI